MGVGCGMNVTDMGGDDELGYGKGAGTGNWERAVGDEWK